MAFRYRNRSLGFSLIEILLVISVGLLIAGVGYVSFSRFNTSQALTVAYDTFVNDVNEAKSDTLSQIESSTCTASQTLVGYRINTSSANYYTIEIVCASDPSSPGTYVATQLKKTNLPTNTSVNMLPRSTLLFLVPNAFVGSSYSARIINSSGTKTLGIDSQGVILQ